MPDNITEILQKRAALVKESRAITTKAVETEKRAMTPEENANVDKIFKSVDELDQTVAAMKKQRELDRVTAEGGDDTGDGAGAGDAGTGTDEAAGARSVRGNPKKDDISAAFRSFLISGDPGRGKGAAEFRGLQSDNDTQGGFLNAPEQFVTQLIKAMDDALIMRSKVTVMPITGSGSLGVPTLTANPADAEWTAEIGAIPEDTSMRFGKRSLVPHQLAKLLKVSRQLLRNSAIPIDALVADRLAYILALPQEKAFLTGDGAGQPLGIFTASDDGVPTSRDVSTGNTATAFTTDGLIECKYSLKSQYQQTGEWLFHRDAVKMLAKLKDGEGQYLWQPTITAGQPDMLLGRPVNQSENVPNTFTTGLYVGAFCDLSHYWVAESQKFELQRLEELYSENNQVGFHVRAMIDGQPVLAEAFSRVKLG